MGKDTPFLSTENIKISGRITNHPRSISSVHCSRHDGDVTSVQTWSSRTAVITRAKFEVPSRWCSVTWRISYSFEVLLFVYFAASRDCFVSVSESVRELLTTSAIAGVLVVTFATLRRLINCPIIISRAASGWDLTLFWLWQKWVYQSVQRHTGLTHHSYFFDTRALWRSRLSARVPECQKINKKLSYGRETARARRFQESAGKRRD